MNTHVNNRLLRLLFIILAGFAISSAATAQTQYTLTNLQAGNTPSAKAINNMGRVIGNGSVPWLWDSANGLHNFSFSGFLSCLNDAGDIAGTTIDNQNPTIWPGFLLDATSALTTISFPDATYTWPMGIDYDGRIVGYADIFRPYEGDYKHVAFTYTSASGIHDMLPGFWFTATFGEADTASVKERLRRFA